MNKRIINVDGCLFLKEYNDPTKPNRENPIYEIAADILKKYNYQLSLNTDQEQNRTKKGILRKIGLMHPVNFFVRVGSNEVYKIFL